MKAKLRSITVNDIVYKWHVSPPDEDYGMVKLRIWEGDNKEPIFDHWLRRAHQPITPKFVAIQIDYHLKPVDFYRASGECLCECGLPYRKHPYDGPFSSQMGFESHQWLHRLCNGDLVKL